MRLPKSDSLSLSEAIAFVKDSCGCSEAEAKKALSQAGLDGHLDAAGLIPLSAHPNPKIQETHPVRRKESLTPADWSGPINWNAGKVGRYLSVSIKRVTVEAWLAKGEEARSTRVNLKWATEPMIDAKITAVYDEAKQAGEKPPNIKEIGLLVQKRLDSDGYQASLRRIQELAGADKHANRRRPPGKTVASEKKHS